MTPNRWRPTRRLFCPRHLFRGTRTMLTRRRALAILGAAGIGTGVFQRALAAKAVEGPISPQMVADAEWVAGIKLTAAQREAAAGVLSAVFHQLKLAGINVQETENMVFE